jgi:hypothetical protein
MAQRNDLERVLSARHARRHGEQSAHDRPDDFRSVHRHSKNARRSLASTAMAATSRERPL